MSFRRYSRLLLAVVLLLPIAKIAYDVIAMARNCGGRGYADDTFLSTCEIKSYGGYEHGAFYFGLEPEAVAHAKRAEVVFFGHSRMMFAFGEQPVRDYFLGEKVKHYLLGFQYAEGEVFAKAVFQKLNLNPKLVVLNVDERFFDGHESSVALEVRAIRGEPSTFLYRKYLQLVHRGVCAPESVLRSVVSCPDRNSFFRSRSTGEWDPTTYFGNMKLELSDIAFDYGVDAELLQRQLKFGKAFLAGLPVPRNCIVLTTVPKPGAHLGTTTELARQLGVRAVVPPVEGLKTFDSSHLDAASAAVYSSAFMAKLPGIVKECVTDRRNNPA